MLSRVVGKASGPAADASAKGFRWGDFGSRNAYFELVHGKRTTPTPDRRGHPDPLVWVSWNGDLAYQYADGYTWVFDHSAQHHPTGLAGVVSDIGKSATRLGTFTGQSAAKLDKAVGGEKGWGGIAAAVGTAVQAVPVIGQIVGTPLIALGAGLSIDAKQKAEVKAKKQAEDAQRQQAAAAAAAGQRRVGWFARLLAEWKQLLARK